MNVEFDFDTLVQKHQYYNVQGKVSHDPLFFYSKKKTAILSFIIQDINKQSIECVAFGEQAVDFKSHLQINKVFQFNYVETIDNIKYTKTSHAFKLQLTIDSQIITLREQKYIKNNKICVRQKNNKKVKKSKKTTHQLSITNWLK